MATVGTGSSRAHDNEVETMKTTTMALAWLCMAGAALAGAAQAATLGERVASQAQVGEGVQAVGLDSFANVSIAFPAGVTGLPNVTYQTLPGYRPMTLDLFLPPESFSKAGPRPWVMYVHGGGWVMGGPRRSGAYSDWPKVLASLAAEGYVVASVGYRFSREAPFPAAIQDVKAAIRWLRVNAARYNLDPARGMTWGQSAGGHLAALAAVSCGVATLEPPPRVVPVARNVETAPSSPEGADQVSDCVQGAVVWYGLYDLEAAYARASEGTSAPPDIMNLFLACKDAPCAADRLRDASPVSYVDPKDPPVFLMHGMDDQTVSVDQTARFHAALQAAGVPTQKVIVPEVGHSWIGKTPESTRDTSREALRRSIDFIEATIGDASSKR